MNGKITAEKVCKENMEHVILKSVILFKYQVNMGVAVCKVHCKKASVNKCICFIALY